MPDDDSLDDDALDDDALDDDALPDDDKPAVLRYRVRKLEQRFGRLERRMDTRLSQLSDAVQAVHTSIITIPRFTEDQHRSLIGIVDTMAKEAEDQRRLRTDIRNTLMLIAGTVVLSPIVVVIASHFFGK